MLEVSKKIKTRGIFSNQVHFPDIIGLRISFNGARGWDRFWRQKSENKVIGIWKSIQWVKKLDRGHAKLPDPPFPFSLSQLMDNENLSRFWEVCRKAMLPNRFDNFLQIRFIDSRYIVRGIVPQITYLIAAVDEIQAASVVENWLGFCIPLLRSSWCCLARPWNIFGLLDIRDR